MTESRNLIGGLVIRRPENQPHFVGLILDTDRLLMFLIDSLVTRLIPTDVVFRFVAQIADPCSVCHHLLTPLYLHRNTNLVSAKCSEFHSYFRPDSSPSAVTRGNLALIFHRRFRFSITIVSPVCESDSLAPLRISSRSFPFRFCTHSLSLPIVCIR